MAKEENSDMVAGIGAIAIIIGIIIIVVFAAPKIRWYVFLPNEFWWGLGFLLAGAVLIGFSKRGFFRTLF